MYPKRFRDPSIKHEGRFLVREYGQYFISASSSIKDAYHIKYNEPVNLDTLEFMCSACGKWSSIKHKRCCPYCKEKFT